MLERTQWPGRRGPTMRRIACSIVALLLCCAWVEGARADGDTRVIVLAQVVGEWVGDISSGHCSCKDQCEIGRSRFSQGRTVAQCKAKCQRAFSGCTRGEIRSRQRRD